MTKVVATLGPSVRLIVIQFLLKEDQVPGVVPSRRTMSRPTILPSVPGTEVMPSTKDLFLLDLALHVSSASGSGDYEIVDCWKQLRGDGRFAVRYVFCRNEYIRAEELHPDFVAKRNDLVDSFLSLALTNLWTSQAHLNPYFEDDRLTGHKVLMIGCTGRNSRVDPDGAERLVYEGGRDVLGQGIGKRVSITLLSPKLVVGEGHVLLMN